MGRSLTLFIHSVLSLFFMALGTVALLLAWFAPIRLELARFILERSFVLSLFGVGLFLIGLALAFSSHFTSRKRSYETRIEKGSCRIDDKAFQSALSIYFKEKFPREEVSSAFTLKEKEASIWADLPPCPLEKQKALAQEIEKEISALLEESLGYRETLALSLRFPPFPP